jgi:hypothetical protein
MYYTQIYTFSPFLFIFYPGYFLNRVLPLLIFVLPFFLLPPLQTEILRLYSEYLGEVSDMLMPLARSEVERVWEGGRRIGALCAMWFALLFVVELVLRVVLLVIAGIIRLIWRPRPSTSTNSDSSNEDSQANINQESDDKTKED